MGDFNLLVCMPAFNGWIQIDAVNSLLDYHRCKIPFSLMALGSESLVTRARNTCLAYFNHLKQFSNILFLDSDVGFSGESLLKLISHNKDVIGAAVALRGFDKKTSKPVYNVGEFVRQEGDLISVDRVGTAVFMLSRKAVDSLIEGADQYQSNPHTRGDAMQITNYDVFQVGVVNGEYLSEDFFVSHRLRELGYEIFVDPTLPTIHNASWQFK